ncbi:LOW QUALITY PROTEIN: myb/SANT-like DNA-binding domain-containing protein 3 [Bombina bombina]|uniref:LOW QUALITY PROTEIN: myb/SANT-like DNA-binding domain-containing protein 3 n=1 Tax=Bombina bombina TaxID=8345 RepID=UPI00235B2E02|nr:LOW QUALITY PROTEIN: myb/SANT-like DNA-binding domain-containing protein 3 [Bombina bombina]
MLIKEDGWFALCGKCKTTIVLKPAKYFSELEKSVLLALVEKYKYVLECKKSDARTIALKQRTWQALAHEYNSQPSVSLRDFKQLKKCWENIKARTKKIMAIERREKIKRFGPVCSINQALKDKVASMIPEQLYFVQNPGDESGYNHDNSNEEIDCKRVNMVDLELLIDEEGKIQAKQIRKVPEGNSLCAEGSSPSSAEKTSFHKGDLELLIDEQGKIQTEPIRKVPVTDLCSEDSPSSSIKKESFVPDRNLYNDEKSIDSMHNYDGPSHSLRSHSTPSCSSTRVTTNRNSRRKPTQNGNLLKMNKEEEHHQQMSILQLLQMNEMHAAKAQQIEPSFHKGDLELLIDEQGKIQTEPIRKVPVTDLCSEDSPSISVNKESFVVPDRDLYNDEKSIVNMHNCEGPSHSLPSHSTPSCSSTRLPANRTYRSKASQNGILLKMHEEEHHQQMSILQLQLIQMNEVHVAKVQQIERECEMCEEEHRVKMEILNKKKMYWERKLQTITKEWPVASFNRPFPNSP